MRETGWSWDTYMNMPQSVVTRLLERLDHEAQQRDKDRRVQKRHR